MTNIRVPWAFDRNLTQTDLRMAKALEYQAYYLDRIDQSLDRIASALETGAANEPLRLQLLSLQHLLKPGAR